MALLARSALKAEEVQRSLAARQLELDEAQQKALADLDSSRKAATRVCTKAALLTQRLRTTATAATAKAEHREGKERR